MMNMKQDIRIKRALISVSNKTNLVPFAKELSQRWGAELISTGGTRKVLEEAGIPVTEITAVTGNPESFGGRMKTLSFAIGSALLFDREKDAVEAAKLGIKAIDMVICNLYPFEETWKQESGARDSDMPSLSTYHKLVENLDIGGPCMIRAAAKNFAWVTAVTDPTQYGSIMDEMNALEGRISWDKRVTLMRAAFNRTADYDASIAMAMDELAKEPSVRLAFDKPAILRYGENPHQKAEVFRSRNGVHAFETLHGKEISWNNILDLDGAVAAVAALSRQGCAVVKHNNPCGLCESDEQRRAFELAWEGDPVSAFGSVVAFNSKVELNTVQFLQFDAPDRSLRKFVEVVVAPDFAPDAMEYLMFNKNVRIVRSSSFAKHVEFDLRLCQGLLMRQEIDSLALEPLEFRTIRRFSSERQGLVNFGIRAAASLKSNAIAIVRATHNGCYQLLGMGAGQPNRVVSTRLALEKAKENLLREYPGGTMQDWQRWMNEKFEEVVLVSDAFFPFADSIDACGAFGVKNIVEPGGSMRDEEVIKRADALGMALAFTGRRHFRH